ncbi:MAG: hypothetical protein RPG89_06240 [Microcystis panniformis WG22]|nr:hypothetical protein [Microcystis panniformis WG22]
MTKSLKVLPNKVFRFFQPTLHSGDWRETLDNWVLKVGLAGGDQPQRHKEYKEEERFKRAALTA